MRPPTLRSRSKNGSPPPPPPPPPVQCARPPTLPLASSPKRHASVAWIGLFAAVALWTHASLVASRRATYIPNSDHSWLGQATTLAATLVDLAVSTLDEHEQHEHDVSLYVDDDDMDDDAKDRDDDGDTEDKRSETKSSVYDIYWDGTRAMDALVESFFRNTTTLFCQKIHHVRRRRPHALIRWHVSFGCRDLFQHSDTGTGNYLHALYALRLAAAVLGNVQVVVSCPDANATRRDLVLPWWTGTYGTLDTDGETAVSALLQRATSSSRAPPNASSARLALTPETVCGKYTVAPIGYALTEMRHELRRMAIALVGPHHASADFAAQLWNRGAPSPRSNVWLPFEPYLPAPRETDPPLFHVDLDDAVIHFRCGDVVLNTTLTVYGFMPFEGYTRHISPAARTIGIVTQPLHDDASQQRPHDAGVELRRRCRSLVTALHAYVRDAFPRAHVTVRNDPNETIALTYARIIMANQSVGAMSTFSAFPMVATFGTAYYLLPTTYSPTVWLRRAAGHGLLRDSGRRNVILFREPSLLLGSKPRTLWKERGDDAVLQWFRQSRNGTVW